ncbi:MAG: TrmB family transcriptional regulator [Candidatus Woesearchaeota archaeon]|nr:MAG: TrmB family transcriptional regulator [Candidatus Woesearchaeota archaeon]
MLQKLRQIGLTEYESKIYLAALKQGASTGYKLAQVAKIPQGKAYEALLRLEEKGFAAIIPVKPKLYKAIQPKIAINQFITHKLSTLRSIEEDIINKAKEIKTPKEFVESITITAGSKNMWSITQHFYKNAQKEIKLMITYDIYPFIMRQMMEEALSRGIKFKILATKMSDKGLKWMREDIESGAEVKYFPVEEIRLTIVDRKEVLQGILNPRDLRDRVNIYIRSKELAKALNMYFESIWKKATDIR